MTVLDKSAIGWDIGGAHLKAAHVDARPHATKVMQIPCALWRGIDQLEAALQTAHRELPACALHAVTMTGELADSFENRSTGVRMILQCMERFLPREATMLAYAGQRRFVVTEAAIEQAMEVASANWQASAQAVSHRIDDGLLIDVGSTTTDMVVVNKGRIHPRGICDADRLACDELVYLGVARTPVMALVSRLPYEGAWIGVAAEQFATLADVFRLTGDLPEHADLHPSADGGEKTLWASARRLARMIGRDCEPKDIGQLEALARYVSERALRRLHNACFTLISRDELGVHAPLVGAGVGRFLVRRLAERMARPYLDFSSLLPGSSTAPDTADCAPAVAVATLILDDQSVSSPSRSQ